MTGAVYDPARLVGDVQKVLNAAGIYPAPHARDLPSALMAARALLTALDVATPAVAQPACRWRTTYLMSLVDRAADVVLEQATAANRTEVGLVASRWRAHPNDWTRQRIDIQPVVSAVPAGPGYERDDPVTGEPVPAGVEGFPLGGRG